MNDFEIVKNALKALQYREPANTEMCSSALESLDRIEREYNDTNTDLDCKSLFV